MMMRHHRLLLQPGPVPSTPAEVSLSRLPTFPSLLFKGIGEAVQSDHLGLHDALPLTVRANCLISLCLCFSICRIGIVIVYISKVFMRIKRDHTKFLGYFRA